MNLHVAERPLTLPTWEVQSTSKDCQDQTQENKTIKGAGIPSAAPVAHLPNSKSLYEDLPLPISGHHWGPMFPRKPMPFTLICNLTPSSS